MSDIALMEPLAAAGRIGPVRIRACRDDCVEFQLPGELGLGKALLGLIPIVWAAAAWTVCLREHVVGERLKGCIALSIMALVSAALMLSSLGVTWRFDGKRRRVIRRVGLFARSHNARRLAGLRLESTKPGALKDVYLRMTLVNATGQDVFEIASWNRRETDRAKVDALAEAIRRTMNWPQTDPA